ncbi:MAG: sec-independent protein translocase protein TatA [Clostridia bacterium]|jgi:sec-independent protein translocase protein TatA|nr:tatA [Clostridiales bacterium]MDK2985575.1 sec-independent protein translocase protein TatA [Clostridia bacterium]
MLGFLPSIGPWELGVILIIALLIFGPGKLPEVAKFLGKGVRDFKKALNDVEDSVKIEDDSEEKSKS